MMSMFFKQKTVYEMRISDWSSDVCSSERYETQGMTVFEAASLGTPSVVSDADIADELGAGLWRVADGSTAALAATIRAAADDIVRGSAPVPEPRIAELFRQYSRTAAMAAVYERAIAAPAPGAVRPG